MMWPRCQNGVPFCLSLRICVMNASLVLFELTSQLSWCQLQCAALEVG